MKLRFLVVFLRCRVICCNGYFWWRVAQHSADQVSLSALTSVLHLLSAVITWLISIYEVTVNSYIVYWQSLWFVVFWTSSVVSKCINGYNHILRLCISSNWMWTLVWKSRHCSAEVYLCKFLPVTMNFYYTVHNLLGNFYYSVQAILQMYPADWIFCVSSNGQRLNNDDFPKDHGKDCLDCFFQDCQPSRFLRKLPDFEVHIIIVRFDNANSRFFTRK